MRLTGPSESAQLKTLSVYWVRRPLGFHTATLDALSFLELLS